MKDLKNCKTYIINTIGQAGGKSYKEYTWEEVLNYFEAPEDISEAEKHDQIYNLE